MIRKHAILFLAFLLVINCFPLFAEVTTEVTTEENRVYERDDVYKQLELFNTALAYVLSNYYKELTKKELDEAMSSAIKGMMEGLGDRYSFYQAETSRKREQENLFYAKFGGLGIRILPSADGFVSIVQPMDGTPAMKAGLHSGDKIIRVDGKSIENMSIDDVVDILRGEVGTKVTLAILRTGMDAPFDITITRDIINFPSVREIMIGDGIAYMQISSFTAETATEMRQGIDKLKLQGMRALIIDLRNNTGGMLTSAVDVSNAFIPDGVIVSTDGRIDRFDSEYRAKRENVLLPMDFPLAVLVNYGSASGSEIFAGAIKDYKRGIIIGEKTFGKGVVQQRFPLDEYSAVSITVSIYKTPNGNWIHDKFLFNIDKALLKDLDANPVSDALRQEFSNKNISLSTNAIISAKIKDYRWQIKDNDQVYTVKKEEGDLKVYQGGIFPDIEVEQPDLLEGDKDGEKAKMLTKMYEGEYVDKYVYGYLDKHPEMIVHNIQDAEEQLNNLKSGLPELMKTLSDNGINLSERIISMYVKRTFSSTKNVPNIDMENDLQLAKAVEEMRKKLEDNIHED